MLKPNITLIADRLPDWAGRDVSGPVHPQHSPHAEGKVLGQLCQRSEGWWEIRTLYNPINPNPYYIKATLTFVPRPRPASAPSTRASRRRSPPTTRTSGIQLSTKASQFSEKAFLLKADILCSACVDSMCLNAHLPKCFNSILHCKYCEIFAKFRWQLYSGMSLGSWRLWCGGRPRARPRPPPLFPRPMTGGWPAHPTVWLSQVVANLDIKIQNIQWICTPRICSDINNIINWSLNTLSSHEIKKFVYKTFTDAHFCWHRFFKLADN